MIIYLILIWIIFYNRKQHYDYNGELKKKDIIRQQEIISELKCKFYRYNENKNVLYEIF
jgi:hypothetical protein